MLLLGFAVLALVALGFALYRGRPGAPSDRREAVLALYQARREELTRELRGAAEADAVQAELDAALLDDLPDAPERTAELGRSRLTVAAVLVGVAAGIGSYWWVGDPTAVSILDAQHVLREELSEAEIAAWRERLEQRLAAKPEDAASWYLNGHLRMRAGDYAAAAEAFSEAHALQGEDLSIDAYWLQARYMAAGGRLDAQSVQIAERIVAADPGNRMVLELLAVERFRAGEFAASLGLINRALAVTPEPEGQAALAQLVTQVREHIGEQPPSIDVAVAVADAAAAAAPRQGTVFVIARPVGGGVPLAVVRRPAFLLPFEVRLDDLVSMNPALPLSSAAEAEVVVRLSLSGQPMAQPGDWEWRSEPLTLSAESQLRLETQLAPPAAAG